MAIKREDGWDKPEYFGDNDWDNYYSAVGRFVQMYGRAEARMHTTLKCMAFDLMKTGTENFEWEILDALIGSQRYSQLKDNMKRLMRVGNVNNFLVNEFEYLFAQFGGIHSFRDKLFHHGAHGSSEKSDQFYTSTDETSNESSKDEMLFFTIEMLLNMAYDLKQIDEAMYDISDFLHPGHIDEADLQSYLSSRHPVWRFKSSEIKKMGPKHWIKPSARSPASTRTARPPTE